MAKLVVCEQNYKEVLTDDALHFLENLVINFSEKIDLLLKKRVGRQRIFDRTANIDFIDETSDIRENKWKAAEIPDEILDRRVEITGPVDRKMVINALNSGANVFMADFEDSNSPTWDNCMNGQINLRDAVNRTIEFTNPKNGKQYELNDEVAVLFVRPRGLHLKENNIVLDYELYNEAVPASLVDFGLYIFHNHKQLLQMNSRPYFYLPKLEHYEEARLWKNIFSFSENALGIEQGTIRATVLLETLPAAFQMNEIIYELKDYSAGLNCGRWDYIFSFIKTFKNHKNFVLPDRSQITMTQHFMKSYTQLLVETCHKRGVHAMGGMAAQIPIKNNPELNVIAMEKVKQDKLREVLGGHDGTWVAHPGLISIAKNVFNEHMKEQNQIDKKVHLSTNITTSDLLCVPKGTCTESTLRNNIRIGFQYLKAWLAGNGCVPLNHLMEDAATAEISRAQIWQWKKHNVTLDNGLQVTNEYLKAVLDEELNEERGRAKEIFESFCLANDFDDFLTLNAYKEL